MSASRMKSVSCPSGGSFRQLKSANGTLRYSACPPMYGPIAT